MKKLMTIIILAVSLTSCFTLKNATFEKDAFVRVYENLPGNQDDLYLKANEWMVSAFNNAESVIQHSDKEEGVLIGKYLMFGALTTGMYGIDSRVFSIIDIRVKDGRARLSIQPDNYTYYDTQYAYTKEKALATMEELASSFEKSLKSEKVDF